MILLLNLERLHYLEVVDILLRCSNALNLAGRIDIEKNEMAWSCFLGPFNVFRCTGTSE